MTSNHFLWRLLAGKCLGYNGGGGHRNVYVSECLIWLLKKFYNDVFFPGRFFCVWDIFRTQAYFCWWSPDVCVCVGGEELSFQLTSVASLLFPRGHSFADKQHRCLKWLNSLHLNVTPRYWLCAGCLTICVCMWLLLMAVVQWRDPGFVWRSQRSRKSQQEVLHQDPRGCQRQHLHIWGHFAPGAVRGGGAYWRACSLQLFFGTCFCTMWRFLF